MININSNKDEIIKLQDIIRSKLNPLIDNDFVLLDIPNHRNIGDSLIWKGELEYFKGLDFSCKRQLNRYTFKNSHISSRDTIILLHGGGNFGDIYPSSQSFKKQIVNDYLNNKIIVMPQTIYYEQESNKRKDFEIFNRHKNLYICVRDKSSYDLIVDVFDEDRILLMPDMAFFIDLDNQIKKSKTNKSLFINRTDSEKVNDKYYHILGKENVDILDWPTYNSKSSNLNTLSNYVEALDGKVCKFLKHIPVFNLLIDDAYGLKPKGSMNKYINNGIDFINSYDKIYTTRLHGMILSILLDKEVVVLDNSYGKNRGFYDAWLSNFKNLTLV